MKNEIRKYLTIYNRGAENATCAEALAIEYKTSERNIRHIVRELRREGYPIGSSVKGFWWITDQAEHRQTMSNLKSRAFDMLKTVAIQERITAAELAGQLRAELDGRI